jgi:hypothetical protein
MVLMLRAIALTEFSLNGNWFNKMGPFLDLCNDLMHAYRRIAQKPKFLFPELKLPILLSLIHKTYANIRISN